MQLREIVKAVGGKALDFKNAGIKGISIDSRTINRGELFIAIKGERFDGHDFVGQAFKRGAVAAVVENQASSIKHLASSAENKKIIEVKDTLKTLGDIAHYHRMKFKIPVIGVTGSTGKTTVKEIIGHVLSKKYNILKNEGTRNNLIGLPLTLLELGGKHNLSVLEMGANHLGEIKRLSEIAKPTIGVITNIGLSHLEFLENIHNVFKAKSELLDSLESDSLALLNRDDRFLRDAETKCKKIYFGINSDCQFRATNIETNKGISFKVGDSRFRIALFGRHNVYNALTAIALGQIFGMKLNTISRALEDFRNPFSDRLSLLKNDYLEILNDTYNSNPLSFQRAMELLIDLGIKKRKVVISADMLELGEKSKDLHRKIGRLIAQSGIDTLLTVGPLSKYTSEAALSYGMKGKEVLHFNASKDLVSDLGDILQKDDIVLVKGSRAMHMEEVVEKIQNIRN